MAEESYLWDNPGTGDSPALGYGHQELMEEMFRQFFNGTGNRGVLRGWLNELEVTDGGGLNAQVDTGGAIDYGFWYENDAATNIAIANNATEWVVVRASWAAQTARLTAIAPGAFTQNPGVTYDIPLAQVTTVAGAITLITDTREYCLFTTDIRPFGVETANLAADAVTVAKVIDQTRWFDRGAGAFEPDATNPAAWTSHTANTYYRDNWDFVDAALTEMWCTFRVPADFTGANILVYIYTGGTWGATGDVRWLYDAWIGAAGAALASTSGATLQTIPPYYTYNYPRELLLCTLAVNAGDIVHLKISRDGANAADTLVATVHLMVAKMQYTADS
jgi:hypothetical protein